MILQCEALISEMVIEAMRQADTVAQGDTNLFLEIFDKTVKDKVRQNPDILYKDYWRNLGK